MLALHHLALRTRDLERLSAFYQRWLGTHVQRDQRPRSVWLSLANAAVLMIERAEPNEPLPPPQSLELVAFRVSEVERVRLRAALLAEQLLEAETEHTLYLRDPDGRRLAFSSHPLVATPEPAKS
jgi:catechol 2,3-dioxygenase-like lactoylglutathione lyase family enzyme